MPDRPPRTRALRPLDAAALDRLALRYVERFATTRRKLRDYLARKIRERGWEGAPADPAGVAERMAALGYIDDRAFAEARAGAMLRRGLGARRIGQALHHAGIDADDCAGALEQAGDGAFDAALAFARRKRIGPFGDAVPDRALRKKQLAALVRAGHSFALARRIVDAAPGTTIESHDFAQ